MGFKMRIILYTEDIEYRRRRYRAIKGIDKLNSYRNSMKINIYILFHF